MGALPDVVSVQKRTFSVVLVASRLIVRRKKYSATIKGRVGTNQEVLEEMKDQGEISDDLETTDDEHEKDLMI